VFDTEAEPPAAVVEVVPILKAPAGPVVPEE
jgi:hypothetical protein